MSFVKQTEEAYLPCGTSYITTAEQSDCRQSIYTTLPPNVLASVNEHTIWTFGFPLIKGCTLRVISPTQKGN